MREKHHLGSRGSMITSSPVLLPLLGAGCTVSLPPCPLLLCVKTSRCNQVEMGLSWIRVGPPPMTGVLIRRKSGDRPTGRESPVWRLEAETGAMGPQAQGCWQPLGAERALPWHLRTCQRRRSPEVPGAQFVALCHSNHRSQPSALCEEELGARRSPPGSTRRGANLGRQRERRCLPFTVLMVVVAYGGAELGGNFGPLSLTSVRLFAPEIRFE